MSGALFQNENITDPPARTALPFRAEAVYVPAGDSNRVGEFAGLPFEPPFASEDECGETDHDNQVYAESDEQCDQHGLGVSSPFESQVRFCRAFSVGESPPPDLRAEHPG
jgi:hypothetical protein